MAKKIFLRVSLFFLFFLLRIGSVGAFEISGVVVSATNGKPVEFASVFFSNTSIGVQTNEKGNFTLNVKNPGIYQLVVSHMAFQTYSLDLQISADIKDLVIKITEKPHELKAVTITEDPSKRAMYYATFLKEFIGTSKNSEDCVIENPLSINFLYKDENRSLYAFADTFVVIKNKALGYKIKYKLEGYVTTPDETVFYGYPLFENKKVKSKLKKKKLEEKRYIAYLGSPQHFFRSLYNDSLLKEHFVAYKLIEKPKPINPTRFYIGDTVKFASQKDSLRKLGRRPLPKKQPEHKFYVEDTLRNADKIKALEMKGFKPFNLNEYPMEERMNATILNNPNLVNNKKYSLVITKDTIPLFSFISDTIGHLKVLRYTRPFQIKYTAMGEENSYIKQRYFGEQQQEFAKKLGDQSSFVIIKTGKLTFDDNGTYANVEDFFMGGYIGWRKVADMLPIDYEPMVSKGEKK